MSVSKQKSRGHRSEEFGRNRDAQGAWSWRSDGIFRAFQNRSGLRWRLLVRQSRRPCVSFPWHPCMPNVQNPQTSQLFWLFLHVVRRYEGHGVAFAKVFNLTVTTAWSKRKAFELNVKKSFWAIWRCYIFAKKLSGQKLSLSSILLPQWFYTDVMRPTSRFPWSVFTTWDWKVLIKHHMTLLC